ncbi:hypothetical protein [Allofournierella sp.]|uniref:hypothetical protein n=1 Tax=Allofournierella sp. TaxID=1940256 RepID=UPI003AF0E27D
MQCKQKGARLVEQPNAQPQRGAINTQDDTSIVRQAWRVVKRFAALMGCVILALIMIMFAGAPLIGGGMSWTASAALIGTAGWLCWVCYHLADEEMEDQE